VFWLVENKEQFREFLGRSFDEAFVEIIPNNPWQHPSQNSICAFYIRHIEIQRDLFYPYLIPKRVLYLRMRFIYI
jgi:hypothetical protein